MGEHTEISWCDSTFNPWTGCSKVSPGCANCYAERMASRFPRLGKWGPGVSRKRTGSANWRKPLAWSRQAAVTGISCRVFCGSLCDWLDPEVPAEWLADLLALIEATSNLTWMLLSKRPELWRERILAARLRGSPAGSVAAERWLSGDAPINVWLGATVENNEYRSRAADIRGIPAPARFLSVEPMLGPVDLGKPGLSGIELVICGGESGPGARPMRLDWARSLRDQCKAAGVSFFMKQIGGHPNPLSGLADMPEDLRVREIPS